VSELHGKVLDVERSNTNAGARVIVWDKHSPPAPNQLWYRDGQGHIRSALNDMALSNTGSGHGIELHPLSGPRTQWTLEGRKIASKAGECLDIKGASKDKGAEVISYSYKDQTNQHWRLENV